METVGDFDLSQLMTLVSVVETGGFRAAADERMLAPSTVQKHMRELERQLNIQLFERSGRNLTITSHARELAKAARPFLDGADEFRSHVRRINSETSNTVRLACISMQIAFNIGAAIRLIAIERPDLNVKLHLLDPIELKGPESFDQVLKEDIADYVVSLNRLPDRSSAPLWSTKLIVVLPEDHPLRHNSEVTIHDIKDSIIFAWPEHVWSRRVIEKVASNAGVDLDIVTENTPAVAIAMVKAGIGVSVMGDDSSPLLDQGYPCLIEEGEKFTQVVRIHWRKESQTKPMALFLELLQKYMPQSSTGGLEEEIRFP